MFYETEILIDLAYFLACLSILSATHDWVILKFVDVYAKHRTCHFVAVHRNVVRMFLNLSSIREKTISSETSI